MATGQPILTQAESRRETLAWARAIRADTAQPTVVYQLADALIALLDETSAVDAYVGSDLPTEVYPPEQRP